MQASESAPLVTDGESQQLAVPTTTDPVHGLSNFGLLPVEVRLKIYEYLFPNLQRVAAYNPVAEHPSNSNGNGGDGIGRGLKSNYLKLLLLNRAFHDEVSSELYRKLPFEVHIDRGRPRSVTNLSMCGKRGFPRFYFSHPRLLEITVYAATYGTILGNIERSVREFVDWWGDAPLLDLHLKVWWNVCATNFPVTRVTPDMTRKLIASFSCLRVERTFTLTVTGIPEFGLPKSELAAVEQGHEALEAELASCVMGQRRAVRGERRKCVDWHTGWRIEPMKHQQTVITR